MAKLKITPKYMLTCGHLFLFALTFLIFSAQSAFSYSLSGCQELNTADAYYSLTQNVSSSGTCFTIKADNITLDGQGYAINYAQSIKGYGIDNTGGYDNITIKNLNIVQASPKTDAYAVYFSKEAVNNNIIGNTLTTSSDSIYFNSSSANNITNNSITSSDNIGIFLYWYSGSNIISHNIITTNGYYDAVSLMGNCDSNIVSDNILRSNLLGISFDYSNFNRITGNDIVSYDGIVCYHSDSATISNNNMTTSSQGIRFYDCFNNTLTGNRMNTTEDAIFIYSKNMSHYNHTIDTTNTEQGDPIYFYFAVSSLTIENKNIGQLLIINSTNMNVQNVTLDKGGIILDSVTNSKITNSRISARTHGIYAISITSNIISNNFITTDGFLRRSIYLESSKMNTLSDNVILYTGPIGVSINLKDSDLNTLSSNNILSTGSNSIGIDLMNSKGNTISGGSIISPQGYDYVLVNSSSENHFIGTNFTSTRIMAFDENSFFDYNNLAENSISLKTNVSVFANMTRTLIKWSNREMKWNDTNRSGSGLIATYDITGLRPNTHYNIYNTSRGIQTKSYTLATDAHGKLASFTIALKDNTEIKLVDMPPIITINSPENNTLLIANTTHFNITTDENATCTYSYSIYHLPYPYYYSPGGTQYICGFSGCTLAVPSIPSRVEIPSQTMAVTGTIKHSQIFSDLQSHEKYAFSINCTDSAGNSNLSSFSVAYRNKPLTIDLFEADKTKTFYSNQVIKIYLVLTTNYSVDKIQLTITKPDNTIETFDESDFSEYVGAKKFSKLIDMSYNGLTQTGNYTMRLYVNDTQGNSDIETRTFRVFDRKSHYINLSTDGHFNLNYLYYRSHDTDETVAYLFFSPQGYSNIVLPDTALDLHFNNLIYTFNVIIPSLNLSDETQNIFLEEKYVNESNMSVGSRYTPKESYAFNILNASRMNKTFKVEFDYIEDHGLTDPTKIVILKAPYNFSTGEINYTSAVYYRLGDPLYPIYYKEPGTAWIYVNDFSVFALLEDKATPEVCADKIDNDYDGQIDEGCTTSGSSSSSGGGSKSAPPIKRECTTNSNCTSTQVCSNYKCINITCSSCEYIEDRACKKYPCCTDSECNAGEQCKDHSCIKVAEEKESSNTINEEQISADSAIDAARKAITMVTGRKDTKDSEEFLSKAIAARNNNDYANAKALAEKSRLSLESAPLIQGKAIESTAERPDLLLIALVAILIVLIIMVLFPKKKSAVSGSKKHQ